MYFYHNKTHIEPRSYLDGEKSAFIELSLFLIRWNYVCLDSNSCLALQTGTGFWSQPNSYVDKPHQFIWYRAAQKFGWPPNRFGGRQAKPR
uniref:Uncharacterized protein n=1 Tax=Romanomermis culicivorax TaxID=13658 RepID=A0A915ICW2_ROMCU